MKMFKKITIVGVGLIGGSIGLAARKKKLANKVVGVCRRKSSLRKALKFKTVDKATLNLKEGVRGADLVIIAAPLGKVIGLAKKAAKFMRKGAILTDVGSTKRYIVWEIEKCASRKVNFIGCHPMAGSEKSGAENASSNMFNNAALIITKTKNTNRNSLGRLKRFWKKLGCQVFVIQPGKHDLNVSLASYLPHAVSSALTVSQVKDSLKFAAGSLKDATRVSSSDPELWKDIFLSSREPVLKSIGVFSRNLKKLENAIKKKDGKAIKTILSKAKNIRDSVR